MVNSTFYAGYYIKKISDDIFNITVWLDLKSLRYLDQDNITEANCKFYDIITDGIINLLNADKLIIAGIGIETEIDFGESSLDIIKNSHNVIRWLIPSKELIQLDKFIVQNKGDFNIYSLQQI